MKIPFSLFRKKLIGRRNILCAIHSSALKCAKVNVCVVGSGPAGFYTAQHLLKENKDTHVDIYEKLPVPFGLIRFGVAPDHPEIKNCINAFTKIATSGRCNFYGNVDVGKNISVEELLKMYNAVVLSYGASENRNLGIPGENLDNIFSARTFVGWYNGLPENAMENVNLDTEVAAVIGHGNVALDVARVLLRGTDELKTTDITDHAFEVLKKGRIKKVVLIGRRGPLQVAFTVKELREMTKLSGCQMVLQAEDFKGVPDLLATIDRPRKRLTELMLQTMELPVQDHTRAQLELKFFRTPKTFLADPHNKVEKLVLGINKLEGLQNSGKVIRTPEEEVLDCGLVITSVGYRSNVIDPCIPFNASKCVIPNKGGRVLGENSKGLYCSGWVRTGPKGVIPGTMNSSYETGERILLDLKDGIIQSDTRPGSSETLKVLKERGVKVVDFDHWKKIDEAEVEKGKAAGKPRTKIVNVTEMLQVAGLL